MVQSFQLREQAERCRRLARDSTDPKLRDTLMGLADEYAARAQESKDGSEDGSENESEGGSDQASGSDDKTIWRSRDDDDGAA
jgi:hypothetical protein